MTTTKFLLGRKKGMTQFFREDGTVVPVTVVEAGPCVVVGLRTRDRDGYEAVQVGARPGREKHVAKPQLGSFQKAGVAPQRDLREFRVDDSSAWEVGQSLGADVFETGDVIDVIGTTKGKGFAGTIKAHGFSRGPVTHGGMNVRRPGSIGQCAWPARTIKGLRMARHQGAARCTVKNLTVEWIDAERGVILVRGAVPGAPNGLVQIRTAKTGGSK